jgi:Asp-tRNA(Asn)/Glu-tRNA(Gln) amidotransferase A subunit family amidase
MSAAATDLWRMSATDLAGAIRSRQVSSREVIEAHLQRIEAVDPSVNAITTLLADQAPKAAAAADRAVAAGGDLPPLLGVPFTVKENIDLAGALATGMTPLGLGNDGLGSLRWPAQCCGISVLKPTLGRIPAATTIEPATAKTCAWTPPPRWRTGSASSRPSIPGSQMATGPRHGGVMEPGKDKW